MPSQFIKGRVSDAQGRPLQHTLELNVPEIPQGAATDKFLVFNGSGFVRYVTRAELIAEAVAAAVAAVPAADDDDSVSSASPLTTKGDIWGYNTADDRIPVGTDGDVLTSDSGDPLGVSWQTPASTTIFDILSANNRLTVSQPDLGAANVTLTVVEANIDHDALTNFSADEHVAHSGVTLTAGVGLAGGGTIAANRTFDLDITELTEDTSPDEAADFLVTYDTSASAHKKVKPANIDIAGLTGTLAITHGGTGQTAQDEAFDALAPTTTEGDIIYRAASDNVALAIGTAGQILQVNSTATAPDWVTIPGVSDTVVVLGSDQVTASGAPGQTFADANLSFPVAANTKYWFKFTAFISESGSVPSTGEGCLLSVNLTNAPTFLSMFHQRLVSTPTTYSVIDISARDGGVNAASMAFLEYNVLFLEGVISIAGAADTLMLRFRKETNSANTTITLRAGTFVVYRAL